MSGQARLQIHHRSMQMPRAKKSQESDFAKAATMWSGLQPDETIKLFKEAIDR